MAGTPGERQVADAIEEAVDAVREALERGTPRLESVRLLLRRSEDGALPAPRPAPVASPEVAALTVDEPILADYDELAGVGA